MEESIAKCLRTCQEMNIFPRCFLSIRGDGFISGRNMAELEMALPGRFEGKTKLWTLKTKKLP